MVQIAHFHSKLHTPKCLVLLGGSTFVSQFKKKDVYCFEFMYSDKIHIYFLILQGDIHTSLFDKNYEIWNTCTLIQVFPLDMFYPCCGDDFVVQQVLIFADAATKHSNFIVLSFISHISYFYWITVVYFHGCHTWKQWKQFFYSTFLCGFYYCYFLLSRYFPIIIQTSGFAALRLRWRRTFGFAKRLAAPHRPLAVGVLGPTRSNNKAPERARLPRIESPLRLATTQALRAWLRALCA